MINIKTYYHASHLLWDALVNSAADLIADIPDKIKQNPDLSDICALCGCSFDNIPVKDIATKIDDALSDSFTNNDSLTEPSSPLVCWPCFNMLKGRFRGKAFAITPSQYIPLNPSKEKDELVSLLIKPPEFPVAINIPPPMYKKHMLIDTTINYSFPLKVFTERGSVPIPKNFKNLYELGEKVAAEGGSVLKIIYTGQEPIIGSNLCEKVLTEIGPYKDTSFLSLFIKLLPKRTKTPKKPKNKKEAL